jgi:hypothetical protein
MEQGWFGSKFSVRWTCIILYRMFCTVETGVHNPTKLTPTTQEMVDISGSYGGEYDECCHPCRMVESKLQQLHSCPSTGLEKPLPLREVEAPTICRQTAHEGGKVVSPMHWPPLPQDIFLVPFSISGSVNPRAIVRPERLCRWKIPKTPSGIEPTTFRNVEQCLNQLRQPRYKPA